MFSSRFFLRVALLLLLLAVTISYAQAPGTTKSGPLAVEPGVIHFEDVARQAELNFLNVSAGTVHKEFIIETTGNGAVIFDYDNDGWPDIYLPNGSIVEGFAKDQEPTGHLYHNNRDRLDPKLPAAHYNLGRFFYENGKYDEAERELETACHLQPNFASSLYFLALTEIQNNQSDRSTELLRQVIALRPDNADAQYLLGQNPERAGNHTEAVEHWKAAVQSDPNHSQALYNLARTLNELHNSEAAQYQARFDALQKSQQITDRVKQLGNFALEAANAQNWPQAVTQTKEAIQLCGDCSEGAHPHRNLGLFYGRTGRISEAEKELHTALDLQPNDAEAQKALTVLENLQTAGVR